MIDFLIRSCAITHYCEPFSLPSQAQASLAYANFRKTEYINNFKDADPDTYTDPDVKRKVKLLKDMGLAALDDEKFELYMSTRNNMSGIYNSARICPYNKQNCNLQEEGWTLDPEIELKMAESTDYDEMKYIWVSWTC